jgi:hypothetical protein
MLEIAAMVQAEIAETGEVSGTVGMAEIAVATAPIPFQVFPASVIDGD